MSVVVITHNRRETVVRTIERLVRLEDAVPVIVVDNASGDCTVTELRSRFPQVKVLEMPRNLGAYARTVGAEAAGTRYVAFCDDDCTWRDGSLARAAQLLDRYPQVGLLCAHVLVGDDARVDPASVEMARGAPALGNGVPGTAICGFLAGASVVRCDAFLRAGGFEQRFFIGAEEALLSIDLLDAGWSLVYCPELVVYHHPEPANRDPLRRRTLELRNRLWTSWLRHSMPRALAVTIRLALAVRADRAAGAALLESLRGVWWIARRRRPVKARLQPIVTRLVR